MLKLSNWISDPDSPECYMRVVLGTDSTILANRVAFIEKTPRVRVAPFTTIINDFQNWQQGYKGCSNDLGSYQPSRDWCDQKLVVLG